MKLNLLLIAGVFLSSCSPGIVNKYYDPALLLADISYQPKPMASDSLKSAIYISGGINQREMQSESNSYDMINMLQFDVNRAHTFNYINASYGFFAMGGYFKNGLINNGEPHVFDKKNFSAIGLRGSLNTFYTKNNVDYRLLGIELSYSQEFGNYSKFRKSLQNQQYYYSIDNTKLFTAGVTTEMIVHSRRKEANQLGTRLFIGKTFNKLTYKGTFEKPDLINVNIAIFGQLDKFHAILEGGTAAQLRLGYRL
jgi:hypothetical protein